MNTRRAEAAIARVEVRAARADPVATRLQVERLLGMTELRPRSLPPSAILSVRALRDPMPGALVLDGRLARPAAAWQHAMQREIDRVAREAAWPARAAVPPTAEAVAFADEAELLACAGLDLAGGMVAARWWWPLLLGAIDRPQRAIAAAWLRAVEHAPAALARLAMRGVVASFVRALDPQDVNALIAAIAVRFALPHLAPVVPTREPAMPPIAQPAKATPPLVPPWQPFVVEARVDLSPDARVLVGVALTLIRAPVVARSVEFAARVVAWRSSAAAPAPLAVALAEPAIEIPPTKKPSLEAPVAEPPAPPAPLAAIEPPPSTRVESAPVIPEITAPARDTIEIVAPARPADIIAPPPPAEVAPLIEAPSPEPIASDARQPRRSAPPAPRKILSLRHRPYAAGTTIETELGGLFYLLNLSLYVGLYGDEDNLALDPWDFVTLVGRALLGDDALTGDPVWPLLAWLAGRDENAPPGAGFALPPDWRPPPQLAALGESPPSRDWLERLMPLLRARLRLALAAEDAELPALLLLHHARVHASDTQVDVVLSLDALPLDIRFAGLDRDPGWVAAARRFVAFHFESES